MEAKIFGNQRCILTGADVDVRDMLSSVPYVVVSVGEQGFAAVLAVLVTGASQSRQHGKSESDSYYLSD
ncbi:hypothetical protein Tco_1175864 [Tanacetum coccineum]